MTGPRGVRNNCLDRALGTRLVEILGDATDGLRCHHIDDAEQPWPAGGHRHQHQQGPDLHQRARPECEAKPIASSDPTTIQIGENPEELIEEKEEDDLESGIAELVKMKHHQPAKRAIS